MKSKSIDWNRVTELRKLHCTQKSIADHIGCCGRTLRKRARKADVSLALPGDKRAISETVEEIENFWSLVDKLKEDGISLTDFYSEVEERNKWNYRKTNRYLHRFNILKDVGKFDSRRREIKEVENSSRSFNETERLVLNFHKGSIKVLKAFRADFLLGGDTIIEAKRSTNKYSVSRGIVQLLMASDLLEKRKSIEFEKRIYAKESKINNSSKSSIRKDLNHFGISVYLHSDNGFVKSNLN